MAVRMRLTRVGSKKNPIYRVVVADSRSPRDGRFIEIVGRYNPQTDPSTIELDEDKVRDWLDKGAQPRDAVAKLIKAADISQAMAELLAWLARGSSTSPTRCASSEVERDDAIVLRLHVAPDDVGKVIGRQGRIARALRTIVRASAARVAAAARARDRRVTTRTRRRSAASAGRTGSTARSSSRTRARTSERFARGATLSSDGEPAEVVARSAAPAGRRVIRLDRASRAARRSPCRGDELPQPERRLLRLPARRPRGRGGGRPRGSGRRRGRQPARERRRSSSTPACCCRSSTRASRGRPRRGPDRRGRPASPTTTNLSSSCASTSSPRSRTPSRG